MANFERDLNCLADKDRLKRKGALTRLLSQIREPDAGAWEASKLKTLTVDCLRRFEDPVESCRELSIAVVSHAVRLQSADVLEYVLPSIAARIGVEPVREEAEELRRALLEVAGTCLDTFPHDLGQFLDFFPVILTNCVADAFPDLKKLACEVIIKLAAVEPRRIKSATVPLAKAVKQHVLNHKHSVVRCEGIRSFGVLVAHGAAEMLGDMRDEQDNRTTVHYLYQLVNDRSDAVRKAALEVLSTFLLDITDRGEQPRRLLPHVLSLCTDPLPDVRADARMLLQRLGKLHEIDHADNGVDLAKRRVTIKDIEWYADDEFPDMSLTTPSPCTLPDLTQRPTLAARHAVAEHLTHFLEALLADMTAVNWQIPHSNNRNRRVVALRTLAMAIVYCENGIVQHTQQILQALYKVVRDDDKEVATEGLLCAELLGKFLRPEQYLPFLLARSEDEEDKSTRKDKTGKRLVTLTNAADGSPAVGTTSLPTLFSTAGNLTKASILVVMRLLLLGARTTLNQQQGTQIVKALCDSQLANLEAPELMLRLVAVQLAVAEMLLERQLVAPRVDAPPSVDPATLRTLDSMLMYRVLEATACEDPAVVAAADAALVGFSKRLFGDDHPYGLLEHHFGRWVQRHKKDMPPSALKRLLQYTPDLKQHGAYLQHLFCERLSNIKFNLRVADELALLSLFRDVVERPGIETLFNAEQLELLVRSVVLPLLQFQPGAASALFRKVAFAVLPALLHQRLRKGPLSDALRASDGALADKIAGLWLQGADADDAEVRYSCAQSIEAIGCLPLPAGTASEFLDHIVSGLNDSSDHIVLTIATQLRQLLYSGSDDVSPAVVLAVHAKLESMVQTLLVHLDDHRETVGIKDQLCLVLKRLKGLQGKRDLVHELVLKARNKHATPRYCDDILHFEAQ